jgi:hypothetical protein
MTFEIENNIPLPTNHKSKYPFLDMEIGQSFCVPVCSEKSACAKASRLSRDAGIIFRSARVTDPDDKHFGERRFWRLK